ncbi:MAG: GIY-YIG nuclease family protein [Gemmatimonadetes bacterium]|nr:GIY-YIG nuclease family protein [Gemmatimonadota bacterium]
MTSDPAWTVYIVRTWSGRLYTGITVDVQRRFAEHAGTARGAKFFRTSAPERVVYQEPQGGRSEASRRESQIKRMSRAEKLELIAANGTYSDRGR